MSTKKIREALEMCDLDHPNMPPPSRRLFAAALAEVEDIEKAARELTNDDVPFDGRFGAVALLEIIAKESTT